MYPCPPLPFPSMPFPSNLLEIQLKTNISNSLPACHCFRVLEVGPDTPVSQKSFDNKITNQKLQWLCSKNWGKRTGVIEHSSERVTRNYRHVCACVMFLKQSLQTLQDTAIKGLCYLFCHLGMQLQSWQCCCCWNWHNFTLTKQEEERTDVDVHASTGWWQCIGTEKWVSMQSNTCTAAWADGSHYFLWYWTLLCEVVSVFVVVAGCISNMTEAWGSRHSAYWPAVTQRMTGRQL